MSLTGSIWHINQNIPLLSVLSYAILFEGVFENDDNNNDDDDYIGHDNNNDYHDNDSDDNNNNQ